MSGHFLAEGVSVVMAEVGDQAFFTGVLESSDFAEEF